MSIEELQPMLGNEYTDGVTKFKGVATAFSISLNDAPQVALEALVDGKPVTMWFAVDRLDV